MATLVLAGVMAAHLNLERARVRAATAHAPQDVLDIPERIGTFTQEGGDDEVSEDVKEVLETSLILMRNYRSSTNRPVSISIVYAGTTRRSLHFPEVCLVGQGWEIREQYTQPVAFSFTGKHLVLVKGNHQEAVLYWFKTGDKQTGNFFLNSWHWTQNQIMFKSPTSAMVRISTPVVGKNTEEAFAALEDFATAFEPILRKRVK